MTDSVFMPGHTTLGAILHAAIGQLRGQPEVESPGLEAHLLIGHALGLPRETLIAHPERMISPAEVERITALIESRRQGLPIAYLIGRRAFFDRDLVVSNAVLIPRPETELIVTTALRWAANHHPPDLLAIDVGTGSGAIAVTLADHIRRRHPQARVLGIDISLDALRVARRNALNLPQVAFIQSDLLEAVHGTASIIAANLPYIPTAEYRTLAVARYEPRLALDGGPDGLDLIRRLVHSAPDHLARPGILLIEHAFDQGEAIRGLAAQSFPAARIDQLTDDAGLDRVVVVVQ